LLRKPRTERSRRMYRGIFAQDGSVQAYCQNQAASRSQTPTTGRGEKWRNTGHQMPTSSKKRRGFSSDGGERRKKHRVEESARERSDRLSPLRANPSTVAASPFTKRRASRQTTEPWSGHRLGTRKGGRGKTGKAMHNRL